MTQEDQTLIKATHNTPNPDIKIEVFPVTELLHPSRRSLLHNINDLLNDAYVATDSAAKTTFEAPEPIFTRPRIQQTEQLVQELGADALIAICTDRTLSTFPHPDTSGEWEMKISEPYSPGKYGTLVATAAIAKWKGKVVENFKQAMTKVGNGVILDPKELQMLDHQVKTFDGKDAMWNWEIKTCASSNDPKYRGKGLITQCVDVLTKDLLAKQVAMNESHGIDETKKGLKLWITALEGSNNPIYWAKRGFVKEGEPDVAPKGVWGSSREFLIQTLSKEII